ncbi:hypothetical protein WJU23_03680 [Prosthecobacter sp. SYSU 5D2]|uniref:VHL beta domain-containing protein n=1 Tax=Prosthecobacter sp. SYSU 5D2 TaxID=3134134 RepID=UPI0031FED716
MSLLLTPVLPLPAGQAHPAEKKGIKSENSDTTALITFHNRSSETVKVYWLDFSGKRVLYLTLPSQEKVDQSTYLTHPWLITDSDGNAWHVVYPDAQPRTVEIFAPAED